MTDEVSVSLLKIGGRDVFYMQYRDPLTGRKVKKSTKTTKRREAERAAAKWEQEVRAGLNKRHGRMAWEEFRERYEEEVVAGLAATTDTKIGTVFNMVERYIKPTRVGDITADRLATYAKRLRDDGRAETTIKGNLAHLRAALAWAVDVGLIAVVPKMPKLQRAKATKIMKGRPITGEEFDRMLSKVEAGLLLVSEGVNKPGTKRKISDDARAAYKERQRAAVAPAVASWEYLLRGLYWSGLRLGEALELHWTDTSRLHIDLSCRHPMLRIPAEMEKGHKDRLLPIAPEFAEMLLATPPERRVGFVFNPRSLRADKAGQRLGEQQVMRGVASIGKAAKIKTDDRADGKAKYASAHDLRRSFGTRWAARVMPQVLMELMRHESIETTLRYYVGRNAQATASILWAAAGVMPGVGATLGATPAEEDSPQTQKR